MLQSVYIVAGISQCLISCLLATSLLVGLGSVLIVHMVDISEYESPRFGGEAFGVRSYIKSASICLTSYEAEAKSIRQTRSKETCPTPSSPRRQSLSNPS